MDRLDRLAAYFNEKEKKRLSSLSRNTQSGLPEMTEDEVKLSCLENNGIHIFRPYGCRHISLCRLVGSLANMHLIMINHSLMATHIFISKIFLVSF